MTIAIDSGTNFGQIAAIRSGNRINLFQNGSTTSLSSQDVISLAPAQALFLAAALIRAAAEPKDPVTNADRAAWGGVAVETFSAATGITGEEPDLQIADLLADLMHYTDAHAISFADALDTARDHYAEEIELETANGPGGAG
jgi:hypothetical protein